MVTRPDPILLRGYWIPSCHNLDVTAKVRKDTAHPPVYTIIPRKIFKGKETKPYEDLESVTLDDGEMIMLIE
jgi:hypothetical protein